MAVDILVDILDLPGLVTTHRSIDQGEQTLLLEAEITEEPPTDCPCCGAVGSLYKHAKRPKTFRDSPIRQYKVTITVEIQRLHCRICGKAFNQDVPGMVPVHWMTYRCVRWIREQCLRDTFAHVAEHIGCSIRTVRNIAKDYIWERNERHTPYLPEWLGIDEIAIGGRVACILTDIGRRQPIDMLKDRLLPTVTDWLWNLRESTELKGVTMDMWLGYKTAVRSVFPDVPIVIDKFHVLQMANSAMDRVRIKLSICLPDKERTWWLRHKILLRKRNRDKKLTANGRKTLNKWLHNEPELKTVYWLKEMFFGIFDLVHKHEAARELNEWRYSVLADEQMKVVFEALLTATENWETEILAYFDHRDRRGHCKTNAYTEGLNSKTRASDRAGRGYKNFEVLRARVLFRDPQWITPKWPKKMPPEWKSLKFMKKPQPVEDMALIEEVEAYSEISPMQNALLNRYGDVCGDCGGRLEKHLLRFYRSLPPEYHRIASAKFHLFCSQCRQPFFVNNPELLFSTKGSARPIKRTSAEAKTTGSHVSRLSPP